MPFDEEEPDPHGECAAEIARLRAIIKSAMQRLNESGTGTMGLTDTVHATHAILRTADVQQRGDGSQ